MSQLLLLVQYTMKPGTRQAFVDEMNASGILQKIREEEGYVSYNYYFDVAEADKLLLVEEWASEDKQQNHLKTAHMNAFQQIKEKYVLSTSVEKLTK